MCEPVLNETNLPMVYNGDLFTVNDCREYERTYPGAIALMLGRGLVANPALAQEIKGGERITRAALRRFHDKLYQQYAEIWPKNALIGHMHETMKYIMCCFEDPAKPRKAMRKATKQEDYLAAVDWLFDEFPLKETPAFLSDTKL